MDPLPFTHDAFLVAMACLVATVASFTGLYFTRALSPICARTVCVWGGLRWIWLLARSPVFRPRQMPPAKPCAPSVPGAGKRRSVLTSSLPSGSDDVHSSRDGRGADSGASGSPTTPDTDDSEGTGKLIATRQRSLSRKDLRDLVRPEDVAEAENVARRRIAAQGPP